MGYVPLPSHLSRPSPMKPYNPPHRENQKVNQLLKQINEISNRKTTLD